MAAKYVAKVSDLFDDQAHFKDVEYPETIHEVEIRPTEQELQTMPDSARPALGGPPNFA